MNNFLMNRNPISVVLSLIIVGTVFIVNAILGLFSPKVSSFSDEEIYKLFNLSVPHR